MKNKIMKALGLYKYTLRELQQNMVFKYEPIKQKPNRIGFASCIERVY